MKTDVAKYFELSIGKEYWLGLDNIYALTNRPGVQMNLRVSMEKFGDEKATAYYYDFSLKDKVHAYCLEPISLIDSIKYSFLLLSIPSLCTS